MIKISGLTKAYGDKKVLEDLSLELPEAGIVRIMGESGIGKTTLLNIIAGLESPDSGSVEIKGSISMVFQEDRLLSHLSALENVAIAQKKGSAYSKRDPAVILSKMGLGDELSTRASKLSGGMARRVAIARALAKEADIYIMDEPVKGLDADTAEQVIDTIVEYTKGHLLIVVTHSGEEFSFADIKIDL